MIDTWCIPKKGDAESVACLADVLGGAFPGSQLPDGFLHIGYVHLLSYMASPHSNARAIYFSALVRP